MFVSPDDFHTFLGPLLFFEQVYEGTWGVEVFFGEILGFEVFFEELKNE